MINIILYRRFEDAIATLVYQQLIVPYTLRLPIMQQVHGVPIYVHFAIQKTVMRLQQLAYRRGSRKDAETFFDDAIHEIDMNSYQMYDMKHFSICRLPQ